MEQKLVLNDRQALNGTLDEITALIGNKGASEKIGIVIEHVIGCKKARKLGIIGVATPKTDWSLDGYRVQITPCYAQVSNGDHATAMDVVIEPYDLAPRVSLAEVIDPLVGLYNQAQGFKDQLDGIEKSREQGKGLKSTKEARILELEKQLKAEKDEHRCDELESEIDENKGAIKEYDDNFEKLSSKEKEVKGLLNIVEKNIKDEEKKPKVNPVVPEEAKATDFPLMYRIEFK